MNRRDDFLAQVEGLAERQGLSDEIRRALGDELRAHLEASIQARMETGESMDEAEANAIRAFGPTKKIIASLGEVHVPKSKGISRPFLLSALALMGSYSCAFGFPSASVGLALLFVISAAFLWFVAASFRERRVQPLAILVAAVPCWLLVAIINSTHSVSFGVNSYRTTELPHLASLLRESSKSMSANADAFDRALREFNEKGGDMALRGFNIHTGAAILRKMPNHEAAVRSWQFIEGDIPEMRRGALDAQRQADEALAAYARPWFANIPGNLLPAAGVALLLIISALIIHLPILFLRWFAVELAKAIKASRRTTRPSSVISASEFEVTPIHQVSPTGESESESVRGA